jgi:hypothetical protein
MVVSVVLLDTIPPVAPSAPADAGIGGFFSDIWPTEPGLGFLSPSLTPIITMIMALVWAVCLVYAFAHVGPDIAKLAQAKNKYQGDKMSDIISNISLDALVIAGLVTMPTLVTAFMKFTNGGGAWIDSFMAMFWPAFPSLGPMQATFGVLITSVLALVWLGALIYELANFGPKLLGLLKSRKQMAGGDMSQAIEDILMNALALALTVLLPVILLALINLF